VDRPASWWRFGRHRRVPTEQSWEQRAWSAGDEPGHDRRADDNIAHDDITDDSVADDRGTFDNRCAPDNHRVPDNCCAFFDAELGRPD
jgi:hypothetical protein